MIHTAIMGRTDWNSNELIQRESPAIPSLSVGATDIAVTWKVPFIDTSYMVQVTIENTSGTLGGMSGGLKLGTKTTTGCTVTLVNTTLLTIGAGGVAQVAAIGNV